MKIRQTSKTLFRKAANFYFLFLRIGIGIAQVGILLVGSITYSQVIAYAVYFFGASFYPQLPWNTCDAWWNTEGIWLRD